MGRKSLVFLSYGPHSSTLPARSFLTSVYLNVEPYTGATMDFAWPAFININITKTTVGSKTNPKLQWTFFEGVKPVVMPIASGIRHAEMT